MTTRTLTSPTAFRTISLTSLAKVSDLKVISRSSVMQYRGRTKNLREIGQSLGVAYVLEGSVRRYSDKIRITAQLIDARTDIHTWAEYYDRKLSDVFAIQSEVAEKIATELKANISASERAAIQSQPNAGPDRFRSVSPGEAVVLQLSRLSRLEGNSAEIAALRRCSRCAR